MNILFDLDDTLLTGDIVAAVSTRLFNEKKINKIYTNKDIKSYDLLNLPEFVRTAVCEAFNDIELAVNNKIPMKGVSYFIEYLYLKGHSLGTLTARPQKLKDATIKYLQNTFNIKWKLGNYFCNKYDTMNMTTLPDKASILRSLNPDLYYDDNYDYAKESCEQNIKTILISNNHTPWNNNIKIDPRIIIMKNPAFSPISWFL